MNKKLSLAILVSSSMFSTAVLSATPDYQRVDLSIKPNIGIGYNQTFYVPYDNKTHHFYFDQNNLAIQETTNQNDFIKNTNSVYFSFKQNRNSKSPEKDNTSAYIHYRDYNNNNCLIEYNFSAVFYNNPSRSQDVTSNCGSNQTNNKRTYTIEVSLN